jgi:hypothetical protein
MSRRLWRKATHLRARLSGQPVSTLPPRVAQDDFSGQVFCSPRHGLVYFAIPKVANTSLKWFMFDLIRPDLPRSIVERVDRSPALQPMVSDETVYSYLKDKGFVIDKRSVADVDCRLSFAVVRDPLERLVSCWRDKIRDPGESGGSFVRGVHKGFLRYGCAFFGGMSFSEFAEAVCRIENERANPHFRDQVDFVARSDGSLLAGHIIRLSSLSADLEELLRRAEVDAGGIHVRTANARAESLRVPTADCCELVHARYRRDYDAFEFARC